MPAATLSKVAPHIGKEADVITLTGTNFTDSPSLTKVFKRTHGDTMWEAITAANVDWVSATEITITIDDGDDDWKPGMNDIGVCQSSESAPEAYLQQALQIYVAASDNSDNVIVGPPDGVYIGGRYVGDLADATVMEWAEEIKKIFTQHSRLPVKTYKGDASYTLTVPLAEWSLENIKDVLSSGATIETVATGRTRLTFGGGTTMVEKDVMLILPGPTGKKVVLGLYRCLVSASGSISWAKDENAKLPLKIEIMADTARAVDDQVGYFEQYTLV